MLKKWIMHPGTIPRRRFLLSQKYVLPFVVFIAEPFLCLFISPTFRTQSTELVYPVLNYTAQCRVLPERNALTAFNADEGHCLSLSILAAFLAAAFCFIASLAYTFPARSYTAVSGNVYRVRRPFCRIVIRSNGSSVTTSWRP